MSAPFQIYVLLPAYNEAEALAKLIPDIGQALAAHHYRIVVVNDGSRDDSADVLADLAKRFPVQVLQHERNQGYGAALKTGFRWILQNAMPDDAAVTLDADNTHLPTYIPMLVQKARTGADLVMACYACPGGKAHGVPRIRRFLSTGANLLLRLRFRVHGLHLYTNGFRAYRVSILQRAHQVYGDAFMTHADFAGGTELLLNIARIGGRMAEVPFELHYQNRGGQSKINVTKTILGYLALLRL